MSGAPAWLWQEIEKWAASTGRLRETAGEETPPVLPGKATEVLDRIASSPLGQTYYLAGGTGLALQLQHRISRDLDFFTIRQSSSLPTRSTLEQIGRIFRPVEYSLRNREAGQLDLDIKGVRVSFIAYPFLPEDPLDLARSIRLATANDIAAMKAYTIGRRAVARDYLDLYYVLASGRMSVDQLGRRAERIFVIEQQPVFDRWLFAKQLTYTDDLDDWERVMDDVFDRSLTWTGVRTYLDEAAARWLDQHLPGGRRGAQEP